MEKLEKVPDEKLYKSMPVTSAASIRMAEDLRTLSWTTTGRNSIGWRCADQLLAPGKDEDKLMTITLLAAIRECWTMT